MVLLHEDYRGYYPAEVFQSGHWGPGVDIYATGMSILHLLSGCQPYGELDSDSFVLDAILRVGMGRRRNNRDSRRERCRV